MLDVPKEKICTKTSNSEDCTQNNQHLSVMDS